MFRPSGVLECLEDKKNVTRIDPQYCGRYVQPGLCKPELAGETA